MKKMIRGFFGRPCLVLANSEATTLKEQLTGWLAARGITLANTADDQAVVAQVQAAFTDATKTALANENTSARLTVLGNENKDLKRKTDELTTALANEQSARQADRTVAAGIIVDAAIRAGIKTVAERSAAITALTNSVDFAKDAEALLQATPVRTTTTNGRDVSGKQSAALSNEREQVQAEYDREFKAQLALCNQDPVKAHFGVLAKLPSLAEKLRPKQP